MGYIKKETTYYTYLPYQNSNPHVFFPSQPFCDSIPEDKTGFLTAPPKEQVRNIVETALGITGATVSSPVKADEDQKTKVEVKQQDGEEESQANRVTEVSGGSSDDKNCNGVHGNDLKRKSTSSFLNLYSKTLRSELDVYLSEPQWENNNSLLYWKSAVRFPKLQELAKRLLAAPATSGGFDRLCPMAACIVRAKRNRLPPHITERLILYKNSLKAKTVKKPGGAPKQR